MADIFLTDKDRNELLALIATKLNKSDYKTTFSADAIVEGVLPIERGGTGETTVQGILEALGLTRAAKIATGSYKGGGGSGAANANVVSFPFQPKVVFFDRNIGIFPWVYGASYGWAVSNTSLRECVLTWEGNTLSWYSDTNDIVQGNVAGTVYNWVAIG